MTLKSQAPPLYNDDVNPNLTFTCIRNKTRLYRRDEKLPDLTPNPSEDRAQPAVSGDPGSLHSQGRPRASLSHTWAVCLLNTSYTVLVVCRHCVKNFLNTNSFNLRSSS